MPLSYRDLIRPAWSIVSRSYSRWRERRKARVAGTLPSSSSEVDAVLAELPALRDDIRDGAAAGFVGDAGPLKLKRNFVAQWSAWIATRDRLALEIDADCRDFEAQFPEPEPVPVEPVPSPPAPRRVINSLRNSLKKHKGATNHD